MGFKLFGHDPSPFVRRVRILMLELGVPFERDANNWQKPCEEFVKASPISRLPMLDRGPEARTRYVYDSRVIAEVMYEGGIVKPSGESPPLQETLWNRDLQDEDKNFLSTMDAAIESAVNVFLLETDGVMPEQSKYLQRQNVRVATCLEWLDQRYENRTTLTPNKLAFVDMALVSALGWLRFRKRADLTPYANLLAVESAFANRPSFSSTIPG